MDVDGVLFKGHFFLHLARHAGIMVYVRAVLLSFLFNINKIPINELLARVYCRFKGITLEQAQRIYKKIVLIKNAKETIETLRTYGYYTVLISSGVPDSFVKDLASRLSADEGHGIDIDAVDDILTGNVHGRLTKTNGKKNLIEEILKENNLSWQNTIVLVDDRNNLDIMNKSGINVGVNAHYAIRQQADYLIDSNNLVEVLDILNITDADTYKTLFAGMRKQFVYSWYQEIRRKFIHILIALVPIFSAPVYKATLSVLFILLIIYLISECIRINGYAFPMLGSITKSSIRKTEEKGIAYGPVTLILGACISLILFPAYISSTVILIVAFSDTAATLIGKKLGRHRVPYNKKKSIEGSMAALIVAFLCGYIYLPLFPALVAAFSSTIIESLPLKSLDNLFMPIGTGIILYSLSYV